MLQGAREKASAIAFLAQGVPGLAVAIARSKLRGDGDADAVLAWVTSETGGLLAPTGKSGARSSANGSEAVRRAREPSAPGTLRLFGWELSYFSGKVRGYLRYKERVTPGFSFDEVVASPEVIAEVLVPETHTKAVPQVRLPDRFVIPRRSSMPSRPTSRARQPCCPPRRNAPGSAWRWSSWSCSATSGCSRPPTTGGGHAPGTAHALCGMPAFMNGARPLPSHREYNERQWGAFFRPSEPEDVQRRTARFFFDNLFLAGLGLGKYSVESLGVTDDTVAAWEASCRNILGIFERHLESHDFVLGGRVSTADFGLLGPLYAHLLTDPVPGRMMEEEFPRVSQWCRRVHDRGSRPERGAEEWLPDDAVPETIMQLLLVFFTEFWPVLRSTCSVLTSYLQSGHGSGPLPGKSFTPDGPAQRGGGRLTHAFSLPFDRHGRPGGVSRGRRFVNPYQVWMLQRVEAAVRQSDLEVLTGFLSRLDGGTDLLGLPSMLEHCRVRKEGAIIFAAAQHVPHSRL
ncbi:unnamed protein product [Prorocentrum cordatum]|uniref:GST C-terminal domain-containing protein n=1 Tax=Prorocentrum cordatum TaxID=2364126 RepID=A0ABN9WA27_9DINO|nr:unnamed protein product [Polarella glacialis]